MYHLSDFMRGAIWHFFLFLTYTLAYSWGDLGSFPFSAPCLGLFLGRVGCFFFFRPTRQLTLGVIRGKAKK
jgi:hypothetical protein